MPQKQLDQPFPGNEPLPALARRTGSATIRNAWSLGGKLVWDASALVWVCGWMGGGTFLFFRRSASSDAEGAAAGAPPDCFAFFGSC